MNKRFKVDVTYSYNNGSYKTIPYWFDNAKQYNTWHDKETSDERIRKIIGIKNYKNESI